MNEIQAFHSLHGGLTIEIVLGDVTEEHVDAIVNAANSRLMHGGGIAAAILQRGGRAIEEESLAWVKKHGPVSHAEPAFTSGGQLPCRYVIHAVGPVWGAGEEDEKLAQAIEGSLRLADHLELHSIAIPPVSTGIYGFPKERAARIILSSVIHYFREHPQSGIHHVRLTILDRPTLHVFLKELEREIREQTS